MAGRTQREHKQYKYFHISNYTDMKIDLRRALEQLSKNEQELIYKLFFLCQTEREVADELGIYHNAVHKKKLAILAKLHKYLKN